MSEAEPRRRGPKYVADVGVQDPRERDWFTVTQAIAELSCLDADVVDARIKSGVIRSELRTPVPGKPRVRMVHRSVIDEILRAVPLPHVDPVRRYEGYHMPADDVREDALKDPISEGDPEPRQ